MPELDSAVLAERVLHLARTLPFMKLSTADVGLFAAAAREMTCLRKTMLVTEGRVATAHYVALTGALRAEREDRDLGYDLRDGAGVLSLLGRRPFPFDLVADPGTVLLVLDGKSIRATQLEHRHLLRNMLSAMSRGVLEIQQSEPASRGRPVQMAVLRPLDLPFRRLLLWRTLGLGSAARAVVAKLARVAEVKHRPSGTVLWSPEGGLAGVIVAVRGAVEVLRTGSAPTVLVPVQAVGLLETIAGAAMSTTGTGLGETTALLVPHEFVQEALEDDHLSSELIEHFAQGLWTGLRG